jgi:hypothetical protein
MRWSLFACLIAVLLVTGFLAPSARAGIVTFSDVTRCPSDPLVIRGVTVSGSGLSGEGAGLPATVSGVGLGSALLGSFGVVDRIDRYIGSSGESTVSEGITLTVDGTINSVTILPFFVALEGAPVQLPFDIMSYAQVEIFPQWYHLDPTNRTPVTISYGSNDGAGISSVYFGISSNAGLLGEQMHFMPYLSENGWPTVTFDYGITVLSMDYTPNSVPDPSSSLLLLGMSLTSLVAARRRWRQR